MIQPAGPRPPRPLRAALLAGALAWLAVVGTLAGPGVTTDEPLDVRPGRVYVATFLKLGAGFFDGDTVRAVFRDNAEHPPLGRWLLGLASVLGGPFEFLATGEVDPLGLNLLAARLAPATAFAALVALIAHATGRRYGLPAGLAAAFALAVMPRPFAHAHLAALDTFIAALWVFALLAADRALTSHRPVLGMAAAGLALGLALLTKIHAWFLFPVVFIWSVVRLGPMRAVPAVAAWAVVGLSTFFAGWPWLWYETGYRLFAYLSTGVARASIRVLYFGTVYADTDVPWHYPWFYAAATVPVGLLLLGAVGLARAARDARFDLFPFLLVGSALLFLSLFSTRVPVYDGERLFLMAFPLGAVLIGMGFGALWGRWEGRTWRRRALLAFLGAQATGLFTTHPFGLSYYNALVGGLRGSERLGLELTYWGDAVDRVLLDRLAAEARAGDSAALVPTLYPGQGVAGTTPPLARRSLLLGDQEALGGARWVIVSRRTAYWPQGLRTRLAAARLVAVRAREGVWLAALYEFPPAAGGRANVSGPSSHSPAFR